MVIRPKWHRFCLGVSTRQENINTLISYDNVTEVDRENCAGRVMEWIRKEEKLETCRPKKKIGLGGWDENSGTEL